MSKKVLEAKSAHPVSSEKRIATRVSIDVGCRDHVPKSATADEIRLKAYEKWEQAGKPIGDGLQFWLEAEQELQP